MDRYRTPPIGVVDKPVPMDELSVVQRVIECIEHKACIGNPAHRPVEDTACEGIDHESHVVGAPPCNRIRSIRKREHVRRGSEKPSAHAFERACSDIFTDPRTGLFAADDALKRRGSHKSNDKIASNLATYRSSCRRSSCTSETCRFALNPGVLRPS